MNEQRIVSKHSGSPIGFVVQRPKPRE